MKQYEKLLEETKFEKSEGPCVKKLDQILQQLNVKRQAFHGKSFIGNHVNKMLKVLFLAILICFLLNYYVT